jgi:uncharacterized protein
MTRFLSSTFILCISLFGFSQESDARYPTEKQIFPFGVVETIDSKILNEKRVLNIYLPQGYHPDSIVTYHTVYVLDGSANEDFPHIAGLVQFLNMYQLMPNSIVVGIANVDRYRDFTSLSTVKEDVEGIPNNGGLEKFMAFIEKEVQPFIAKNYKVNDHRTIIGQSLGGLLATEILIAKPDLFSDYIIVSPSLWWNDMALVNTTHKHFMEHQELEKRIFVSLGKEHPVMHEVADKLVDAIQKSGNKNITLFYEPILTEDHGTILHKAVYAAMEAFNPKEKE